MMLFIVLLFTLLSTSHSANILVIAGLRGSHLYFSTDIADKLAEFGHNVTLVTMFSDNRVEKEDRAFRFITFGDADKSGPNMGYWRAVYEHSMNQPSKDMMPESLINRGEVKEVKLWRDYYYSVAQNYFQGEDFSKLLDNGEIDLIVLENSIALLAMVSLVHRDIPTMGIVCYPAARDVNDRFGQLAMLNNIPSWTNDVRNSPPTFLERFRTMVKMIRFFTTFNSMIQSLVDKTVEPRANIEDYFTAIYDVVFINDHPAFSFPFLSPPNSFYLGLFNLEDRPINPLPEEYLEFLTNCPHKHTLLFSFGSHLQNISTFPMTPTIMDTLRQVNACIIMNSWFDLSLHYDLPADKFLQRAWLPQKDLLGSGQLDFFISHCGNNGRMEAIYYNVPLLCIPLLGDQYYNGRLVERNGFGLLLTRETLSEQTLTETLSKMLARHGTFKANMKRAVDIASNDPGSGTGVLKFYTDLLINRNVEHLVNRVILNQSFIGIYNLDIAAVGLIFIVFLSAGVMFCLVKLIQFFCTCSMSKIKSD